MRMLTINKPVHYGYKSIHDLPTPPNTSRPSPPPLTSQDYSHKSLAHYTRSRSPPSQQPMSGTYRGLPPPAAMSSGQPLPPGAGSHPPPPPGPTVGQGPPPSSSLVSQSQQLGQLPPPPGWQSPEDTRAWLHAKAEEDKRKQEEERTNQERFRLEQRKTEFEILRASLQGGIPPPMVPVVFAGMGSGTLPPAALDMAQQFAQQFHQQQQLLPGPASPEHRRDSHPQAYGHYPSTAGVPSTPGSAPSGHGSFVGGYPGSPRARGYTVPVAGSRPMGPGSGLSSLNTSVLPSSGSAAASQSHPSVASAQQQETQQQSPSIYFHMWQPPTSQASQPGSNQPATPSGASKPKHRS